MISIAQIRMARTGHRLSQGELAKRAGLSLTGYQAIEAGASDPKISHYRSIQAALESAGACFDSGGVRIEEKPAPFVTLGGYHQGDGTARATKERVDVARAIIESGRKRRAPYP